MIDREKVLAVLHKRFPTSTPEERAAAANAIQLPEGRTVWRATCRAITPEAISGDELRQDNGRLLKAKLAECASACADELWANYAGSVDRSEKVR